ncbi:hypothetical protein GEOBRER4_n2662 [Citrifermentans bremense]|uniref:Peptidase C14 caspase domain-containing protein n=1 Tax=Citrifermentans bremense TaxID=60035 RepID=A0A6S6M224_9BACT|nr:caspase family protein [Citrifermentans bremense]BCG47813.1 hypothetical protein GEOBRER4_n2662 [Citrifermentans bremense]
MSRRFLSALFSLCLAWQMAATLAFAAAPPREPMLRIETGMHTAMVKAISIDAAGHWMATASEDKTVRVWDLAAKVEGSSDPAPVRILRPHIGPGNEGKLFAVAISPDGGTIACGGWTGWDWQKKGSVYFYSRATGKVVKRLDGFPNVIKALRYSPDGRRIAVALGAGKGVYQLRVSDWKLAGADRAYGNDCYGLEFDAAGRLATASWDGFVRLYDDRMQLLAKEKAPNGELPYSIAFTADGGKLAVGCDDSRKVAVLSGSDLTPLYTAPGGADSGSLFSVAWSADGTTLYAAGSHRSGDKYLLRRWEEGGKGEFSDLPIADGNVMQLASLPGGALAYAAAGPEIGVTEPGKAPSFHRAPGIVDHRGGNLLVSADGSSIGFGYGPGAKPGAVFALGDRSLRLGGDDDGLYGALLETPELRVTGWRNGTTPLLNGLPLRMEPHEASRSLALGHDRKLFLLGTDWNLRCFDRLGKERWHRAAPAIVWQVNVSANGKVAVAALGDGTIRWYRMSDGKELLAFFPHADKKRWVLWTPSGYYDASVGGEELAGWHLNSDTAQGADFFPVSRFRLVFCRPDVINRLLAKWDDAEAGKGTGEETLLSLLPPVVSITSPQDKGVVEQGEVTVDFTVRSPSGEAVTGVKVLVNGRPVSFKWQGTGLPLNQGERRKVTFALPAGESEVAVIAENRHAASEPATISVSRTAQEPEPEVISLKPRLFILSIGIGGYPDPELALDFAAKDAKDFASLMQLQKGGLYGDVSVKLLTDAAANRQAVLDGLKWLSGEARERDTAIVFLSGHGVTDAGGAYYFLPVDGKPGKLGESAVVFSEIRKALMSLPGKAVLFVDTCHAGDVMGGKKGGSEVNAVVNDLSSAENGVVVFASSTGRQYSIEDPAWGNGAFTKALVEGISGKADYTGKGRITVASLDLWLSERVQELTGGKQTPTTAKPRTVPDFPLAVKKQAP